MTPRGRRFEPGRAPHPMTRGRSSTGQSIRLLTGRFVRRSNPHGRLAPNTLSARKHRLKRGLPRLVTAPIKQLTAKSHRHPPPEDSQAMSRDAKKIRKTTSNSKKTTPPDREENSLATNGNSCRHSFADRCYRLCGPLLLFIRFANTQITIFSFFRQFYSLVICNVLKMPNQP